MADSKCKNCGKPIVPRDDSPSSRYEAKRKKFCGHSCAAKWNNRKYPKKTAITDGNCLECGKKILFKKLSNGSYSKRDYCDACRPKVIARKQKERSRQSGYIILDKPIENYTKGELRKLYPNYNYFGSKMAKHARSVYMKSDSPKHCHICGYDYCVDVCHIKDISKFSDGDLVGVINDLTNLVALCKNHHKEFDDGVLQLN